MTDSIAEYSGIDAERPGVDAVIEWLSRRVDRRAPVALALSPAGYAVAVEPVPTENRRPRPEAATGDPLGMPRWPDVYLVATDHTTDQLAQIEAELGPRWVWWDRSTSAAVAAGGLRLQRCWDVVAVQALLVGGNNQRPAGVWCALRGLDPNRAPTLGQMTLIAPAPAAGPESMPSTVEGGSETNEISARNGPNVGDGPGAENEPGARSDFEDGHGLSDGYLRPEWVAAPSEIDLDAAGTWAATAYVAAGLQRRAIASAPEPNRLLQTAHAESATELLCAELADRGLPFDTGEATRIITAAAGPRPADRADEARLRADRDRAVLALVPPGRPVDLRNPDSVREALRRVEVDVPDTRAWRLREVADRDPLVPALLRWRKAERLSNTYGYQWMDDHVEGRRLRGEWSSYDGAAGRMTASAGLHNLPAELRPAVTADAGYLFVRADLGQIEPRVLAAVSGDNALIAATGEDDLYRPVANRLGVERATAKVAVLGAMYGSTTGEAANALRGLDRAYPVAMSFLNHAADEGRRGRTVYTVGGRPVHMWEAGGDGDLDRATRVAAARGRFARNAVIQGAAAEFFKMWAVTVRARTAPLGAEVVLCLHDELVVHAPADEAAAVSAIVDAAVDEVAGRWSPHPGVRFVADTTTVSSWADAK